MEPSFVQEHKYSPDACSIIQTQIEVKQKRHDNQPQEHAGFYQCDCCFYML